MVGVRLLTHKRLSPAPFYPPSSRAMPSEYICSPYRTTQTNIPTKASKHIPLFLINEATCVKTRQNTTNPRLKRYLLSMLLFLLCVLSGAWLGHGDSVSETALINSAFYSDMKAVGKVCPGNEHSNVYVNVTCEQLSSNPKSGGQTFCEIKDSAQYTIFIFFDAPNTPANLSQGISFSIDIHFANSLCPMFYDDGSEYFEEIDFDPLNKWMDATIKCKDIHDNNGGTMCGKQTATGGRYHAECKLVAKDIALLGDRILALVQLSGKPRDGGGATGADKKLFCSDVLLLGAVAPECPDPE